MRRLLTLFLFFVHSFSADSQLDSISVNAYFETISVQIEDDSSVPVSVIRTETWINDFDFFGELLLSFTEVNSGYTVYLVKKTKAELLEEGLYTDGMIRISGYHIEAGRSYTIKALVRNYQGLDVLFSEFLLVH